LPPVRTRPRASPWARKSMADIFTCTACAKTFADSESHEIHYKLDWHRYNLRRRVAGLSPLNESDFERRLAAALVHNAPKPNFHGRCSECRKIFRSESLYNQHLDSKKHKDAVKAMGRASISAEAEDVSEAAGVTTVATAEEAEAIAVAGAVTGDTLQRTLRGSMPVILKRKAGRRHVRRRSNKKGTKMRAPSAHRLPRAHLLRRRGGELRRELCPHAAGPRVSKACRTRTFPSLPRSSPRGAGFSRTLVGGGGRGIEGGSSPIPTKAASSTDKNSGDHGVHPRPGLGGISVVDATAVWVEP
ncbi:unnamed protein product, partial [Ascophyllum nodosum]